MSAEKEGRVDTAVPVMGLPDGNEQQSTIEYGGTVSSTQSGAADSSVVPLGTVVEVQVLELQGLSSAWLASIRKYESASELQLVASWTTSTASGSNRKSTSETTFKISKELVRQSVWQFSDPAVVQLRVHPPTSNPANPFVIVLMMAPGDRSQLWKLSIAFSVHRLLSMVETTESCVIEGRVCDQDNQAIGTSRLRVRWGTMDSLASPVLGDPVILTKQPGNLSVQILSVDGLSIPSDGASMVWRIRSLCQSTKCAFLSSPIQSRNDISTIEASFNVEDMLTDAIIIELMRYHPRERSTVIAWTCVPMGPDEHLRAPLLTTGTDVYGHVQLTLKTRSVMDDKETYDSSLAASILSEKVYATLKVGDVRGHIEIKFIRVGILPLDRTSIQDVSVRMQLVPGAWTTSSPRIRVSSTGFAEWPESHRRSIQWSSKERVVPSLRCDVNLRVQKMSEKPLALVKQSPISKINSTISPLDLSGVVSVDLPSFFAHQGVWSTLEILVPLRSTDCDLNSTPVPSASVQMKLRFVDGTEDENEKSVSNVDAQSDLRGRLSIASLSASGPFLMRDSSLPSAEYYVSLQCGEAQTRQTRAVKASGEGELVWKDPMVGFISKLPAPLVLLTLHRRLQDQKNDSDMIVGVVALPVFPTILSDNHLVGFALPLVASESGSGGRARKRQGVLSFEIQFIASTTGGVSLSPSTGTRLILHQLVGWRDSGLIPPLINHIRLQVLLMGATVSEALWTHESEVLGVQTQSPTLSLGFFVSLDEAIRKTRVNLSRRLDLVIRVCDVDRNRLGQTIIPVRGSWEKLMEREQEAFHKIYRSSTSGDPEAVAEIQLTIEEVNLTSTSDVFNSVRDPVDGWLYVEILEALNSSVTSHKEEAVVQIALHSGVDFENALRPKPWKSRKQWSTRSGEWSWVDEFASFPYYRGKACTLEFSVLLLTNRVEASTSSMDVEPIVEVSSECPHEEWVVINTSQLHIRFVYLPATTGYLSVRINSVLPLRTSKLPYPVDKIALKCSDGSNSTSSKYQEVALADASEMSVLQNLVDVAVRLSLNFAQSRPRLPYLMIEAVGMSSTLGETRIGKACVPLTSLLSTQTDQWLSCLAPDDMATRISAMRCSFQFRQVTGPSTQGSLAAIPPEIAPHDEWHRLSAAVMTIWKKLFYHLDADRNGKIDMEEFKALFRDHFKLFSSTSDGQTLLKLLTTQSKCDISEFTIEQLFHEMDINGNEEIDWNEYIMFIQVKLLAVEPVEAFVPPVIDLPPEDTTQTSLKQTEMRRKRREDPLSSCTVNGSQGKTESVRPPAPTRQDRLLGKRTSSRVNELSSRVASNERSFSRFEVYENTDLELLREENAQVRVQLRALEAQLALEQQRARRQHEAMQALQRQLTQFQLQQHKARVEEQTRAQRIQETIQRHEQELLVREATRKKHQAASIVLQSRVRTRLETKRYHALRMTRWNAAVRIQCWFRMIQAQKWLKVQQGLAKIKRLRHASAVRLQRFARYHLCRKERQLLIGARNLAATIIQRYTRRVQALHERHSRMRAILRIQSRVKLWLVKRETDRLRRARDFLRHRLRGWALRRRWNRVQCSIRKMQRWWRVACDRRWEYIARLEAAVCIQATWRGILHRRRWAMGYYEAQAMCTENQTSEDAKTIPLTDVIESSFFALQFEREDLEVTTGGDTESVTVLADENRPMHEKVQGDLTGFAMGGGEHAEASCPDLPFENTEPFIVAVEGADFDELGCNMLAENGDQGHTSSAGEELTDEHISSCLYELIDDVAFFAASLAVNYTGADAPRLVHAHERTTSHQPDSQNSIAESDLIGGGAPGTTKVQDTPECEVMANTDDAEDTVDMTASRSKEEAVLADALASVIDSVVALHEQNRPGSGMFSQREGMVEVRPDTEAPSTFGLAVNEDASERQQDTAESLSIAVEVKQLDGESVVASTDHQVCDDEDTGLFGEESVGDKSVPSVDDAIVGDEDGRECEVEEITQDALATATEDGELLHEQVQGTHRETSSSDATMNEGSRKLADIQRQLQENNLRGTPIGELEELKTEDAPESNFADSATDLPESVSPVFYEPNVSTLLLEEDPNDNEEEAEYHTGTDEAPITHPDPSAIKSEPNLNHVEATNEGRPFVSELLTSTIHDDPPSNDLAGEHECGSVEVTAEELAMLDCGVQDARSSEDGRADHGVKGEDNDLQEVSTSNRENPCEDESNPEEMTVLHVSALSDPPVDTLKHSRIQDEIIAMAITDEESSNKELDTILTVNTACPDGLSQIALSELGPSVIQDPSGQPLEDAMEPENSQDIVEPSTAMKSFESPRAGDIESEVDRNADSENSDTLMLEAGEVAVFGSCDTLNEGQPQADKAEVKVADNKIELTRQDSEAFLADFAAFGPTSTEAMTSGSETPVLIMADID